MLFSILCWFLFARGVSHSPLDLPWSGYGKNAQHTALATNPSQPLTKVHWSTPVDTNKPEGELLIHYATPMISERNTVLVPVKTLQNGTDGFKIQAFAAGVTGANPKPLYELTTDYILPMHAWVPPFSATLSVRNRLYYAGPGGTVYYRDKIDSAAGATGQIAFYGNTTYTSDKATFDKTVFISSPMVVDREGNLFFGFRVTGANAKGLVSGVARIGANGAGSWVSAQAASGGDPFVTDSALNCAPALSNDFKTVYFVVTGGITGYLVSIDSSTLAPIAHARLNEPQTNLTSFISPNSSASPVVAPDGDVYYGVSETPCCSSHNNRGWLLHFNATLDQIKTPGSFGWDTTPSIVPSTAVPAYQGRSRYLLLMKYNNYAEAGTGDGMNRIAILDPNATMPDPIQPSITVMKEIMTVLGATPDDELPGVKEWCINSAAIDPYTRSAIVNSEDGTVYRWDFTTGSFSERMPLGEPTGEAYTPTLIGPDGTVYAINDGTLFAIGK